MESVPNGNGHILCVDDEESLALMNRELLTALGYDVTVCLRSDDALKLFQADPGKFDLVITDMTMPNMTGINMAREMLKIRPEIPIVLSTGFNERITEEEANKAGIREFLMKPYTLPALACTVKNLIETASVAFH